MSGSGYTIFYGYVMFSVEVKRKCNGKEESFVLFPNTETERISFVAVKIFVGDDVGVGAALHACMLIPHLFTRK